MSHHWPPHSPSPWLELSKWVLPPLYALSEKKAVFMGARGHPKNLELLIFIIEWLILALYTTRLSASSRLACVESSHVSEYFENRVVDSKNGPFSGSHRRGGEEPGPIPWVGTFTPRNMIHIKIPSPDPLCPAHGVVKEVSTFHLPTLYTVWCKKIRTP